MSNRLREFRQAKAAKVADLNAILEKASPTAGLTVEQKDQWTKAKADIDALNASIELAEALANEERTIEAAGDPNARAEKDARARTEDPKLFKSFGQQLCAVANAQLNKEVDKRLEFKASPTGLNEGVGTDGGYLVQTDFTGELWKRAYDTGQIVSRVRRVPISATANGLKMNAIKESSRIKGSRWGALQTYWEGEGGTLAAARPKFRVIELNLKKLTGLAYITSELLEDAVALESVIREAFAEEFGFELDDGVMRGTGAGMLKGYLDHACTVVVGESTDPSTNALQAADTIIVPNVTNMWARMWARSRANAVWLLNQQIEPQLMGMKIGDTPIYIPSTSLAVAPHGSLLGRPLVPVEQAAALGEKGDLQFVDLSQYIMIDKAGVRADSSMHVRFLNDEMAFRFIIRVDGQPAWDTALTPAQGTDTLSPFVVLGERDGTS